MAVNKAFIQGTVSKISDSGNNTRFSLLHKRVAKGKEYKLFVDCSIWVGSEYGREVAAKLEDGADVVVEGSIGSYQAKDGNWKFSIDAREIHVLSGGTSDGYDPAVSEPKSTKSATKDEDAPF